MIIDIENILIMTPAGRQIPLRAIASIDYDKSPQEITREDQERYVSVNVDIEKSNQLRAITAQVNKILKDTPIPAVAKRKAGPEISLRVNDYPRDRLGDVR